jgi:hypothetical protein
MVSWLGDYFLVLGLRNNLWYGVSFYDDGKDLTMAALSKALGCELCFGLIHSTNSTSRVIWPKEWEGQPLVLIRALIQSASAEAR